MANDTTQRQQITTSDTLTSTSPTSHHAAGHYVILIVMVIVNATAIVGNVCNMLVILKSSYLRHTLSNFFVVNLCTSDLLAAILVMPVGAATFWAGEWPLSTQACSVAGFFTSIFMFVSMTTLSVISVERYYAIRLPMHHAANMTLTKTVVAVLLVWLWAAMLAVYPLFGLGAYAFSEDKYHCSFTWHAGGSRTYVGLVVTLCFLIPLLVLVVTNLGIFLVAKKAATQLRPATDDTGTMTQRTILFTTTTHPPIINGMFSEGHSPRDDDHDDLEDPSNPTPHSKDGGPSRTVVLSSTKVDLPNTVLNDIYHSDSNMTNDNNMTTPRWKSCHGQGLAMKKKDPTCQAACSTEDSGVVLSQADNANLDITRLHPHRHAPRRGHYKAAKTLLLFLAAFVFLWGPYFILHLHGIVSHQVAQSPTIELVALWLSFSSFAVNPFLYGWMNKAIREELVSLYRTVFYRWPCCPLALRESDMDFSEGPPGEDFLQFLERTSMAPTGRYNRSSLPAEEHQNQPDLSGANTESTGPF